MHLLNILWTNDGIIIPCGLPNEELLHHVFKNAPFLGECREVPIEHNRLSLPSRRALTGRGMYVWGQLRVPPIMTLTSKGQPHWTSSDCHCFRPDGACQQVKPGGWLAGSPSGAVVACRYLYWDQGWAWPGLPRPQHSSPRPQDPPTPR